MEAFVPDPTRFDRGQRMSVVKVSLDEVRLECSRHDAATQSVTSQHVVLAGNDLRTDTALCVLSVRGNGAERMNEAANNPV